MEQAVGRVDPDGSRYLLGDSLGNLHMLVLSHDSQRVVGLKLEALGRISAPSTLSYLDSGVVFVVCHPISSYAPLTHSHRSSHLFLHTRAELHTCCTKVSQVCFV